jgi:hypothetical protein
MMSQVGSDSYNAASREGLAANIAMGVGNSQSQAARQRGARRKQAVGEAPLPQKPDAYMQLGNWHGDHLGANPPPSANINLASASDFPSLGGTPGVEEHVVMADTPVEESNGFWERPLRAVKVATIDPSPKNGSRGNSGTSSSPSAIPRKSTETQRQQDAEAQLTDRRARIEDLARQTNLHLDENVLGFLLTVSSAEDVLDYLMVICGDTDDVRRFAQAFGEQRLGATDSKTDREAKGPKETAEANAPKANRRRRGKGKEVDPSLLGFTAASSRIMQGSIDHGD